MVGFELNMEKLIDKIIELAPKIGDVSSEYLAKISQQYIQSQIFVESTYVIIQVICLLAILFTVFSVYNSIKRSGYTLTRYLSECCDGGLLEVLVPVIAITVTFVLLINSITNIICYMLYPDFYIFEYFIHLSK